MNEAEVTGMKNRIITLRNKRDKVNYRMDTAPVSLTGEPSQSSRRGKRKVE